MQQVEEQDENNAEVCSQESTGREVAWKEEGKAVAKKEHQEDRHADIRRPRLNTRSVGHVYPLPHTSLSETLKDEATQYPRTVTRGVRETNEPIEHNAGLRTAGEIG